FLFLPMFDCSFKIRLSGDMPDLRLGASMASPPARTGGTACRWRRRGGTTGARRRWLGRARRKPQRPRSGRSPGTWPRVATAARAARCPAISAAPPRRGGSSWPRPRCRGSRGGWSVWWTGTPLVPWAPSTRPTRAPAEHPAALATGAQKSLRRS
ncbi:unnamed protein product, partial [Prorocentrum cordatum]